MTPFFSIIIPVYNVAPYLRECLDSVVQQTFADWECICIDDGSTDESGKILDEYGSMDARFRIVHKKNEGVSIARNVGMNMALGEYFMFVDGDDSIVPDTLECFFNVLSDTDFDGLLIKSYEASRGSSQNLSVICTNATALELLVGKLRVPAWPWCRIYRRGKFAKLRFVPNMRLREDMCFWCDALCEKANWLVVDKPFYRYRHHEFSASQNVTYKTAEGLLYFPIHVMNNMRMRLHAGRDDIEAFWRLEVREYALDVYFRDWKLVPLDLRQRVVELSKLSFSLLGRNPLGLIGRLCFWCAQKSWRARLMSVAYFIRRFEIKISHIM